MEEEHIHKAERGQAGGHYLEYIWLSATRQIVFGQPATRVRQ